MMLSLPQGVEDAEGFFKLKINDWKTIHFYSVIPIYKKETHLRLKHGPEALLEKLKEQGVTIVVDVHRKNVCRRTYENPV